MSDEIDATSIDSFDQVFSGSDAPLAGVFLMPSGSLRFFFAEPPPEGDEPDDEWREAVETVTFMAYAIDRSDWWKEYSLIEGDLIDELADIETLEQETLAKERRSMFTLIPGGLSDENMDE